VKLPEHVVHTILENHAFRDSAIPELIERERAHAYLKEGVLLSCIQYLDKLEECGRIQLSQSDRMYLAIHTWLRRKLASPLGNDSINSGEWRQLQNKFAASLEAAIVQSAQQFDHVGILQQQLDDMKIIERDLHVYKDLDLQRRLLKAAHKRIQICRDILVHVCSSGCVSDQTEGKKSEEASGSNDLPPF
jgi:hypothetical protein